MPPRKKTDPTTPSTMKELKDTLWKAADKLRGSLSASQYKDVILGLVFLKYVSDAYDERREAIRAALVRPRPRLIRNNAISPLRPGAKLVRPESAA